MMIKKRRNRIVLSILKGILLLNVIKYLMIFIFHRFMLVCHTFGSVRTFIYLFFYII